MGGAGDSWPPYRHVAEGIAGHRACGVFEVRCNGEAVNIPRLSYGLKEKQLTHFMQLRPMTLPWISQTPTSSPSVQWFLDEAFVMRVGQLSGSVCVAYRQSTARHRPLLNPHPIPEKTKAVWQARLTRCKVFFTPNAATAHISIRKDGAVALLKAVEWLVLCG